MQHLNSAAIGGKALWIRHRKRKPKSQKASSPTYSQWPVLTLSTSSKNKSRRLTRKRKARKTSQHRLKKAAYLSVPQMK